MSATQYTGVKEHDADKAGHAAQNTINGVMAALYIASAMNRSRHPGTPEPESEPNPKISIKVGDEKVEAPLSELPETLEKQSEDFLEQLRSATQGEERPDDAPVVEIYADDKLKFYRDDESTFNKLDFELNPHPQAHTEKLRNEIAAFLADGTRTAENPNPKIHLQVGTGEDAPTITAPSDQLAEAIASTLDADQVESLHGTLIDKKPSDDVVIVRDDSDHLRFYAEGYKRLDTLSPAVAATRAAEASTQPEASPDIETEAASPERSPSPSEQSEQAESVPGSTNVPPPEEAVQTVVPEVMEPETPPSSASATSEGDNDDPVTTIDITAETVQPQTPDSSPIIVLSQEEAEQLASQHRASAKAEAKTVKKPFEEPRIDDTAAEELDRTVAVEAAVEQPEPNEATATEPEAVVQAPQIIQIPVSEAESLASQNQADSSTANPDIWAAQTQVFTAEVDAKGNVQPRATASVAQSVEAIANQVELNEQTEVIADTHEAQLDTQLKQNDQRAEVHDQFFDQRRDLSDDNADAYDANLDRQRARADAQMGEVTAVPASHQNIGSMLEQACKICYGDSDGKQTIHGSKYDITREGNSLSITAKDGRGTIFEQEGDVIKSSLTPQDEQNFQVGFSILQQQQQRDLTHQSAASASSTPKLPKATVTASKSKGPELD